jgi:hypothetical protein
MFKKLMAWWNKDREEVAVEETRMTQDERDVAEEDYESRKDDLAASRGDFASGAMTGTDFEADSEKPPPGG